MKWKDDAITEFASAAFELLAGAIKFDYSEIVLVCGHIDGVVAVSAIYYNKDGAKKGVENFFDIANDLKIKANLFHDAFKRHGENFRSVKLSLDSEENLEIEFDYDAMDRWDLSDRAQFPLKR